MFKKILIANRSEIAVRIIRACHEMSISVVAVYSDADRDALYVRMADEAYSIGNPQPMESYLNMDKIIGIARASSADAIHPGYGFLAENETFAKRVKENGLIFIGPSPEAINAMGGKINARRIAKHAGVPIVPGTIDPVKDADESSRIAKEIGYPVMIKAAAGGGGKGMRLVESGDDIHNSFERARSEAESAFGNGELYIEKFIRNPRHIEFQIIGDTHGNMIHLNERECSIQRKHQKLIEESPSPVISAEQRVRYGKMAIDIAKSVGYYNAGTMEFIMDQNEKLYFMEMNTRLQVEHPVTELVTGVDIVKEQIRIAQGERLRYKQEDITISGSAIECRIVAEDSMNDFSPTPGKIVYLHEPSGAGIRVDSGVYEGFDVPGWYDSLITKIQSYGKTRNEAIEKMRRALDEYRILGISTSIPLYRWIFRHERFIKGDLGTSFLEQEMDKFVKDTSQLWIVAAISAAINEINSSISPQTTSTNDQSKWRLTGRQMAINR